MYDYGRRNRRHETENPMIKLIATDVDGTLVKDGTMQIDPEYMTVIKELVQKGIIFAVCSGRFTACPCETAICLCETDICPCGTWKGLVRARSVITGSTPSIFIRQQSRCSRINTNEACSIHGL